MSLNELTKYKQEVEEKLIRLLQSPHNNYPDCLPEHQDYRDLIELQETHARITREILKFI